MVAGCRDLEKGLFLAFSFVGLEIVGALQKINIFGKHEAKGCRPILKIPMSNQQHLKINLWGLSGAWFVVLEAFDLIYFSKMFKG